MKTPTKLSPVTDAVLGYKSGPAADMPKNPMKQRLQDVQQARLTPPPPAEAADADPPARRIPSPASGRTYKCRECHKMFTTGQALGGHVVAKHPKKATHPVVAGGGLGEEPRVSPPAAPRAEEHRCPRCSRTFGSGQGLGCHLRSHSLKVKKRARGRATPSPPESLGLDIEPASAAPAPPSRELLLRSDEELASAKPAPPSKGSLNVDLNEPKDEGENRP
ncbi:hypothetical protein ABZP36_008271 [Zizania latifolia]